MKKTFKYFALLVMGLTMSACSDDDLVNNPTHAVGDEIIFGASASVEAGNENAKKSRTAYGDVNAQGNKIALNWAANDQVDIHCPEAFVAKSATYEVQVGTTASNTSNLLKRISVGEGLQWSDAVTHNFYAVYPAVSSLNLKEEQIKKEELGFHLDTKEAMGYLPVTQSNFAKINEVPVVKEVAGRKTYLVEPNMDYAYMMAHTAVTTAEASKGITLNFTPIVTALEFQITAETFLNENQGKKSEIQLTSCVLSSVDGTDICGKFLCKDGQITNANPQATQGAHNQVTVEMPKGVILSKEGTPSCNVTFFLLPTQTVNANNLKLKIFYENNGTVQIKTAKIGVDIQPKKKYFFKNMVMPPIDADIDGSLWFTAVEDNVLMSQLSIPCAGNTFSNLSPNGLYREQVKTYEELWNMGVRGFEFVNQTYNIKGTVNGNTPGSLYGQPFVCAEEEQAGPTFGEAMQVLVDKLNDPKYKNEFLLIIAKYHAVDDGFWPGQYVKHLCTALGQLKNVTKDRFVKLEGTMTAKDLRGKIAVVVRPADDDYMRYERMNNNTSTKDIQVVDGNGDDWSKNIVLVHNWGKAYDRFDMRYPGYTREATWGDRIASQSRPKTEAKRIEDWLWASSSTGGSTFTAAGVPYKQETFPTPEPNFLHETTADFNAQIQEWARVIPENAPYAVNNGVYTGYHTDRWDHSWDRFLWVKWPSSIKEKKDAIAALLKKSVERDDQGLSSSMFINVLSGYYPTTSHMQGVIPFKFDFLLEPTWTPAPNTVTPEGQGNGGNYAALAAELNTYLFKLLARRIGTDGTPGGTKLKDGPFGIIVMDYIGATQDNYDLYAKGEFLSTEVPDYTQAAFASRSLVYMIMMNNFKFPLKRGDSAAKADENLEIQQSTDEIITD